MKIEKVIDQLKDLVKDMCCFISDEECTEWKEIYLKDIEALNQAIDLLSRNIKKKPIKAEDGDCCCPKCYCNFYVEDLGQTLKDNFCGFCGQAIDWSNSNEL